MTFPSSPHPAALAYAQKVHAGILTLRIKSTVKALKDPRPHDWPKMSNFTRGYPEHLADYQISATFAPSLLSGREVNGRHRMHAVCGLFRLPRRHRTPVPQWRSVDNPIGTRPYLPGAIEAASARN